jgi:signal transduction histidine kinase
LETSNIEHRTPNIELEIDGRAIQQALVNLIDNAIKHSPKGETVTVELKVHSPLSTVHNESIPVEDEGRERGRSESPIHHPPSTIHLSVSDRGPGIPPAEHEKIFERFYRRGSELRRETQGVGIGLSIVKHIIAAHGGRVIVESEPGKGSRFVIELPITKSEIRNPKSE